MNNGKKRKIPKELWLLMAKKYKSEFTPLEVSRKMPVTNKTIINILTVLVKDGYYFKVNWKMIEPIAKLTLKWLWSQMKLESHWQSDVINLEWSHREVLPLANGSP